MIVEKNEIWIFCIGVLSIWFNYTKFRYRMQHARIHSRFFNIFSGIIQISRLNRHSHFRKKQFFLTLSELYELKPPPNFFHFELLFNTHTIFIFDPIFLSQFIFVSVYYLCTCILSIKLPIKPSKTHTYTHSLNALILQEHNYN